ncbi:MAG: hypothetical protein CL840_06495 [Crocinitomicaceae bacterium]|nr:hypothetical protein [Crocinitomicaceae bacterium]|tara:strand:- start:6513 stop:6728 length:216 start_codon:yes stop_codon:yes gene_type:complete
MEAQLPKRQKQVLKLMLAGYTQQEICKLLNLHTNTVSCYKKIIMEKWDAENMVELVLESIKRGYLEIEEEK